jgi:hypothetical protein
MMVFLKRDNSGFQFQVIQYDFIILDYKVFHENTQEFRERIFKERLLNKLNK